MRTLKLLCLAGIAAVTLCGCGQLGQTSGTIEIADVTKTNQYQLQTAAGRNFKAFEQNPLTLRQRGDTLTVHVAPQNLLVYPMEPGEMNA